MNNTMAVKKKGGCKAFFKKVYKYRAFLIMLLPAVIYTLIFSYYPMTGIVLAFKKYTYAGGIWGSAWNGLENFKFFLFLRLGPWVHGEVRNGGFPDWIVELGKTGVELRSNDEVYLSYVRRFWEKIYEQVDGFLERDGGPVIGIQVENEYGHVGGFRGEKGEAHMRKLRQMAEEIGFVVPLYTATGWGGACIGDCLPVMGGYCEAPWDQSITELSANTNYVISHVRNDALIACDHHVEDAVTFDESKFPYLTAELGGGLQVTGHR